MYLVAKVINDYETNILSASDLYYAGFSSGVLPVNQVESGL